MTRLLTILILFSFIYSMTGASSPPMPPGIVHVVRSPKGSQLTAEQGAQMAKTIAPLVVVLPLHTNNIQVLWSYQPTASVAFQVFGTPNLSSNFLQIAIATTNGYYASLTNQQYFFKVRAVNTNTGITSPWATR
jgi:hypothetical protein